MAKARGRALGWFGKAVVACGIAAATLSFGVRAGWSAPRYDALVSQLTTSEDFRVRTQAALALGASGDDRAVQVLCRALTDSAAGVRAAAAAGLGRLRKGGRDCLEKRVQVETDAPVKKVLSDAIRRINEADGPAVTSETRSYVILDTTAQGGAPGLGDHVRAGMVAAMKEAGPAFALAPVGQKAKETTTVLKPFASAKAMIVSADARIEVGPSTCSVKVKLDLFSFPDRAFLGSVSSKMSQEGPGAETPAMQADLVRAASGKAFQRFAKVAAKL